MSILDKTPAWIHRAASTILPARWVEGARERHRHRFYRTISMVERDSRLIVWFRHAILRRKPVLYHFEVHITDHCNLNCKGCAHFSNLCKPTFADLDEFKADMRRMANLFSAVHQIYVMGGEPLLHPQVAEFIRAAREPFPNTRIYLMTNGTLVMKMAEEFWRALAETRVILLCDSYPIDLPVDEINAMGVKHGVEVEWTVAREEFFKIPIDPAGGHDMLSSFQRCQGFNNCPIIRDGRLYPCAYAAFGDVFGGYFGLEGLGAGPKDSISIRDDADPEAVIEFLRHPVPWCAHCDMDSREFYTWGRSSRKLDEWTKNCADQ